ncbi:MAG: hypothetical protein JWN73_3588 [Betaproteobacteria bacterium]|nr:hypothetical protein [Betaproteobacteria bacterium]
MQIAFTLPGVRNTRAALPAPLAMGAEPALVARHRRDWFRILAELQAAGFSNADVARALGLSGSTIRNWKYGIEPIHSKGCALLELHRRISRGRRSIRGRVLLEAEPGEALKVRRPPRAAQAKARGRPTPGATTGATTSATTRATARITARPGSKEPRIKAPRKDTAF